jgi:hypothetical protein
MTDDLAFHQVDDLFGDIGGDSLSTLKDSSCILLRMPVAGLGKVLLGVAGKKKPPLPILKIIEKVPARADHLEAVFGKLDCA